MEHYALLKAMIVVVLTGTNDQYEIRHDIETPTEPGCQEAICKVMVIAICGTDPRLLKGKPYHYHPEEYPFIIGHEWSGIVVGMGLGVSNLEVGDWVAGETRHGCDVYKNYKEGRYSLCFDYGNDSTGHRRYRFIAHGAYCQYMRCSCGPLTPLPGNVSSEEIAMYDTAGVAFHGLGRARVTPEGTVRVIGSGPIGLISMKIICCLRAAHVIAVGQGAHLKTTVVTRVCDLDKVIDFETCERDGMDVVQKVMEMTGGTRLDNVYEASGVKGTMAQVIETYKEGGSIAFLDTPSEGAMVEIPMKKITFKELALSESRGNPNVTPAVVSLIATGQLRVRDLVIRTFPLTQFGQEIDTFVNRKGRTVKVIFYPNEQLEVPFVEV